MSRKRITAGDVAIDRATLGCMAKEEWPNDCPACGARMAFHFVGETPVRVCACGVTVRRVGGRFVVTSAVAALQAEKARCDEEMADGKWQSEVARNLGTTVDNVRVLFAIEN